ncbi:MAG TPA: gas vesicle protein GvpJ [Actinomycetota bacterium]|nr:gas vesicle protein GvpJ [Actinomycetota bacterium]
MAATAATRLQQTHLAQQSSGRGGPSGLADVLEVLLDKGLVIDAFVRVSVVGIELLTIDARIVVASVDTYLRFAEAVNRLDLLQAGNSQSLGDLTSGGGGSRALKSRPSRGEPEAEREDEPEPEHEDEPEKDDERRAEGDDDADDDKGILTRIKERGQVF